MKYLHGRLIIALLFLIAAFGHRLRLIASISTNLVTWRLDFIKLSFVNTQLTFKLFLQNNRDSY